MKNQDGFSMLEVLLSLALISILVTGILSALSTSSRATITNDVQTTAQNLAEGQIEYVRNQTYDNDNPPEYLVLADVPAGYNVVCNVIRLDPEGDGSDDDDGLQKIAVTVSFNGVIATTLEAYRVK